MHICAESCVLLYCCVTQVPSEKVRASKRVKAAGKAAANAKTTKAQ
jgi:hypothetical protein